MTNHSNLMKCFAFPVTLALASASLAQSTITLTDDDSETCVAELANLTIDTSTGDVSAKVVSLGDCGSSSPDLVPVIDEFTVGGKPTATVVQGNSVQVAWASTNTTSCSTGGTLQSWANQGSGLNPDGTFSAPTTGVSPGDYTLELTCSGSSGEVDATPLTVTVEASQAAEGCDTRPPPPNLDRATDITADYLANAFFFAEVFQSPFPGTGNSKRIRVPSTTYVAMEFNTGDMPSGAFVAMRSITPSTSSTGVNDKLWSISKCPGDFRQFVIDDEMGPGCVVHTTGPFDLGGSDFRGNPNRCALEPNTTYFMNFMYTDDLPPSNETQHGLLDVDCSDFFCGNGMKSDSLGF